MKVGAIAYQNVADSVELCFVSSRRHRDTITLPKGIVKSDETLTKAAARELFEEAGVSGKVKRKAYPLLFVSKKPAVDDILYFYSRLQLKYIKYGYYLKMHPIKKLTIGDFQHV